MNRKELKACIKENELNIKVKKSMSDDDIRDLIREALAPVKEKSISEEEEEDEEEEEKPKTKGRKKMSKKGKKSEKKVLKKSTKKKVGKGIDGGIVPANYADAIKDLASVEKDITVEHKKSLTVFKRGNKVVASVLPSKEGPCVLLNRHTPDEFAKIKEKKQLGEFRPSDINAGKAAFLLTEKATKGQQRLIKAAYKLAAEDKKASVKRGKELAKARAAKKAAKGGKKTSTKKKDTAKKTTAKKTTAKKTTAKKKATKKKTTKKK